eukprot:NODE_3305_length_803_cov_362.605615.p1 GENE.NODE_3305_length_803_cov_362.605615~~NODE_3305_length_803_cov_362.605615.p1  ORF type:complete len:183 (-),score=69.47 NODE_3305_length_803_cov_362.605615:237-785(-)
MGGDNKEDAPNYTMFLDMTPSAPPASSKSQDPSQDQPFAMFKAAEPRSYEPLTRGRMGFLIVFDVLNKESFEEAKTIINELMKSVEGIQGGLQPIVYLVANKIDKEPFSEVMEHQRQAAKEYAKKSMLKYMEVSAIEYTRVRKLFRDIVEDVAMAHELWVTDSSKHVTNSQGGTEEEACSVQ